jgi:hypothetical protein
LGFGEDEMEFLSLTHFHAIAAAAALASVCCSINGKKRFDKNKSLPPPVGFLRAQRGDTSMNQRECDEMRKGEARLRDNYPSGRWWQ